MSTQLKQRIAFIVHRDLQQAERRKVYTTQQRELQQALLLTLFFVSLTFVYLALTKA